MSIDVSSTASLEAVKVPPVPGVQKPPHWVGKRFRVCLMAAPGKKKVKKPGGLKTRPIGCGRTAWAQTRQSAAAWRAARRGVCCRAVLKAADSDHLVLRPDPDGEGAGAAARLRLSFIILGVAVRRETAITCFFIINTYVESK